jgi:hypothetical protein
MFNQRRNQKQDEAVFINLSGPNCLHILLNVEVRNLYRNRVSTNVIISLHIGNGKNVARL